MIGTGSSRKSATNSVLWVTGADIHFVPNKRFGGVSLGAKNAPIFFSTMEDAGAMPIELDCGQMDMGDEIELRVEAATAKVTALKNGTVIAESQLNTTVIMDEVRAGDGVTRLGLRMPCLLKLDIRLDRPVVAGRAKSPRAASSPAKLLNFGLAERPLRRKLAGGNGHIPAEYPAAACHQAGLIGVHLIDRH